MEEELLIINGLEEKMTQELSLLKNEIRTMKQELKTGGIRTSINGIKVKNHNANVPYNTYRIFLDLQGKGYIKQLKLGSSYPVYWKITIDDNEISDVSGTRYPPIILENIQFIKNISINASTNTSDLVMGYANLLYQLD